MVEDWYLIWKFKLGDGDALRRIYEKYKNDLLKLTVALVGDVNTAGDVVQDVFVAFAQSAATIRPTGNLRKYLVTCAANRIRNLKRDRQRHETPGLDGVEDLVGSFCRPEQWAMLSEELEQLRRAMAQLPDEQREVIGLYLEGHITFRQIGKIQNVSISTVYARYRYGMNRLRSILNGELRSEAGQ
jgi:RNA polymerase sigma-70 factor (ECF subfamily)